MRICHFRAQNGPLVLNKIFLVQTIVITFIYLLALFTVQNFKKFLQQIRVMRMHHFWTQNGPFAPNSFFFGKLLMSFSSTYQPLWLSTNFKNILQADPELWGCTIFGPKIAHFTKWEFSQKSCWWALSLSFMPTYMPKIKVRYTSISEILTIKEYWNLTGWEPFLDITWELDFFQACSFRRMLINHKNFHLTQIPDKTDDAIFLKSPKTLFLVHFWPFLVIFSR